MRTLMEQTHPACRSLFVGPPVDHATQRTLLTGGNPMIASLFASLGAYPLPGSESAENQEEQ